VRLGATLGATGANVFPILRTYANGDDLGRRDRGSNAASPSARYRATSRDTQPCDTPYARATSP